MRAAAKNRHSVKAIALIAALVLLHAPRAGAVDPATKSYDEARAQYYALKGSAGRQKYRHNWVKVIATFTRVATEHPDTPQAAAAVYTSAELWADLFRISRRPSDLDQALAAYERVAHNYTSSSLADDALWQGAQIELSHRHDKEAAAKAIHELLERFPRGDMAPRAKQLAKSLPTIEQEPAPAEVEEHVASDATAAGSLVGRRESHGPTPRVHEIKHWSNPVYTRVAIYLTGPAQARTGQVAADPASGRPARVYVDIREAALTSRVGTVTPVNDDLLVQVRAGQFNTDTVRIVLDLKDEVKQRVMVMENPFRVVVDAYAPDAKAPAAPKSNAAPKIATTELELRGRRVVLDPGHGGKDSGAVSRGGLREKDVVLSISKQVAKLLKAKGVDVQLTRDQDDWVPLEERTAFANRRAADLFVSIHANSNRVRSVRGVETYYLNVTDDRYALRLAALENKTNEEQVSDLQLILADLSTKVNTDESLSLAKSVQERIMTAVRPQNPRAKDLGVKASLFYVLLGARMPSILVETGFLSNAQEAKLLARRDYQRRLANAIATALLEHLRAPVKVARH